MNYNKIFALAMYVFSEVEGDLKDGKLTIGELLDNIKGILDKLGYTNKTLLDLNKSDTTKN